MTKAFLLSAISFMFFISGCGTTKILTDYKDNYEYRYEKVSPVESYISVETRRPKTFPMARECLRETGRLDAYFMSIIFGFPVIDVFLCTPYQLLFGDRIEKYKVNVLFSGQILDGNNMPIEYKKMTVFVNDAQFVSYTDEKGFFEEIFEVQRDNDYKINNTIIIYFGDINAPNNGNFNIKYFTDEMTKRINYLGKVTFTDPFVVQYKVDNDGNTVKREDYYVANILNTGKIQTTVKEENTLSDVIRVKSYEYTKYSKNKRRKKGSK